MQGFKDQIAQMRSDLKKGLQQLDNVNNNAETAGSFFFIFKFPTFWFEIT